MKPAEIVFRAGAVALYWALKRDTLFQGHAIKKISKTFLCEKMQMNTNNFIFLNNNVVYLAK